jgi:predicted dehydrogenase
MTRLRGAIIGYGFIASKGHMPAYARLGTRSDAVKIVAVADPCEARRRAAIRDIPGVRVYPDAEELVREQAGDIDFVDISTPPVFHYPQAIRAIENGLHVLCEKPLVVSSVQAVDLIRRAIAGRVVIMPYHNYKYAPVIKAIRAAIDSERIGKISAVTLNTFRNTHARGMPEWIPDWRRQRALSGGGIAMDHGSHSLYVCFDWLGAYPQSITAKATCLRPELGDAEDNFSASLVFPSGLATIHLTWTAGMRKVIYTVQGESGGIKAEDDEVEISLQRRTNGPDVAQGAVEWVTEKSIARSDWMDASHTEWFEPVFEAFATAIERQGFISRDLMDAYMCVAAIEAGYRSAADGSSEVPIDPPPDF